MQVLRLRSMFSRAVSVMLPLLAFLLEVAKIILEISGVRSLQKHRQ